MTISLVALLLISGVFIVMVPLLSIMIEQGKLPVRLVRNPITFTFSLGVCTSSWALFGSIGYAAQEGYNTLSFYFGIALLLLLAPIVIFPILRLTQTYNLRSLADIYVFRYRSQLMGQLTTIVLFVAVFILSVMQVQSLIHTIELLTGYSNKVLLSGAFCFIILILCFVYGGSKVAHLNKHLGLVFSIAIASFIKLLAFIAIILFVLFGVFDSPIQLQEWYANNGVLQDKMYEPLKVSSWYNGFWLLFFCVMLTPHFYQVVFNESHSPRYLRLATLLVPIHIFITCLGLTLIIFAVDKLGISGDEDYWFVKLTMLAETPFYAILFFLAALASSISVIIVSVVAMSQISVTYLHLAVFKRESSEDFYRWLLNQKRFSMVIILTITFVSYLLFGDIVDVTALGMLSFVCLIQLLPALIGTMVWAKANRIGVMVGLFVGFVLWLVLLFLPILFDWTFFYDLLYNGSLNEFANWKKPAMASIVVNVALFFICSYLFKADDAEQEAAQVCVQNNLGRSYREVFQVKSLDQILNVLSSTVGERVAHRKLKIALSEIEDFDINNHIMLNQLRDNLELELSGILGPAEAYEVMLEVMPYDIKTIDSSMQNILKIETEIEKNKDELQGLNKELDQLRRYHRQLLEDLPVAICAMGNNNEILAWNRMMQELTGMDHQEAIGSSLLNISEPWKGWLTDLVDSKTDFFTKYLTSDQPFGKQRWYNFQKTYVDAHQSEASPYRWLIIIDDATEKHMLQNELAHRERLASIGRLAAGIAHEIGNPVTGIACLAQELSDDAESEDQKELAHDIVSQTQRIDYILKDLVNFSHRGAEEAVRESISINLVIEKAVKLFGLGIRANPISLRLKSKKLIVGEIQQLEQVFINLFNNASDASSDSSSPIDVVSFDESDSVFVHVIDYGSGIAESLQAQIFEPFFTTKNVGDGTGLGLSLVHGIISKHSADISIESPLTDGRQGSCFILRFNAL